MPLPLLSSATCLTGGPSTWRQDDHNAYMFVRAAAGRPIKGAAWVPMPAGLPKRLTSANRDDAIGWFADMILPRIAEALQSDPAVVLVPIPDPRRIVGAPPSRSRALAHEVAVRSGRRVLDVLRWRVVMARGSPAGGPIDPQALCDNLVTTGGIISAGCILVSDVVSNVSWVQAAAARIRRVGGSPILAVSAGRTSRTPPVDPFAPHVEEIADFEPLEF
jgi:hypothetical protein